MITDKEARAIGFPDAATMTAYNKATEAQEQAMREGRRQELDRIIKTLMERK